MKMQQASVNCRFPHQTGVTKRSISSTERRAADGVLHDMVIGHQAHRIGNGFVLNLNREHHVCIPDKVGAVCFDVGAAVKRIKHPLEMVLTRKPHRADQQQDWDHQQRLLPPATNTPPLPEHQTSCCKQNDGRDQWRPAPQSVRDLEPALCVMTKRLNKKHWYRYECY